MNGKYYPVIALKMLLQDLSDYWLPGFPQPRRLNLLKDGHFKLISERIDQTIGSEVGISTKTFKNYRKQIEELLLKAKKETSISNHESEELQVGKPEYRNILAATWLVKNNLLNENSLPKINNKNDEKVFQNKSYWDDYVQKLRAIKQKIFASLNSDEGETLEFKEVFLDPNDSELPAYFRKLICAFANTNGGDIVVGIKEVNDAGTKRYYPVGINPEERIWQMTNGECARIFPMPKIEIRWSYLLDEEVVLCNIRVEKSDTPCKVDNVKWIRYGEDIFDTAIDNGLVNTSNARYELNRIYHAILKISTTAEGKILLKQLSDCVADTFIKYLSDILNEIYIKNSYAKNVAKNTKEKLSIKNVLEKIKAGQTEDFFRIFTDIPEMTDTINTNLPQLKTALQVHSESEHKLSSEEIKEKIKYFQELVEVIDNNVINKLDIVETRK